MAISINLMHDFIRDTILKKNYGSFVSPSDIDKAIDRSQYDLLEEIIRVYDPNGKSFRDDNKFLVKADSAITTGGGNVNTLPADYYKIQLFFSRNGSNEEFEGELLKHNVFQDRRQSVIIPPIQTRPIATIYNDSIEFLPSGNITYVLLYWKNPTTPVYGFTESSGVITFDAGSSTNLDWDNKDFTNIATRALKYLGFSIKDAGAIQIEKEING